MTNKIPMMRRRQIVNRLEAIKDVFGQQVYDRVLAAIPADVLSQVYEADENAWVPVELNIRIAEASKDEIGVDKAYELSRRTFAKSVEKSSVAHLLISLLRLIKIRPSIAAKMITQFWDEIYRDCGVMSIQKITQTEIEIVIDNLPKLFLECRSYIEGIAGGIAAMLSSSGVNAEVLPDYNQATSKKMVYRIRIK